MSEQMSHSITALLKKFALPLFVLLFYYGLAEAQSSLASTESEAPATSSIHREGGQLLLEPARTSSLLKKESRTVFGACHLQAGTNLSAAYELLKPIDELACFFYHESLRRARSPPVKADLGSVVRFQV